MNLRRTVSFGNVSKFNGRMEFRQVISEYRGVAIHGRIRQRTKRRAANGRKHISNRH